MIASHLNAKSFDVGQMVTVQLSRRLGGPVVARS
jgi:hypothetical protein